MPLTLTEAISDTQEITDSLATLLTFARAPTDTVGITDSLARRIVFARSFADTQEITDSIIIKLKLNFTDAVGITDSLRKTPIARPTDTVGIVDGLGVHGVFVQYDTWRPIPKPDNTIVLVCRTPSGEHDTDTGRTHMTLWTVRPDGTGERPCVLSPTANGYGWSAYGSPAWSPDGNTVVLVAETATEFKLILLDSSGFGQ